MNKPANNILVIFGASGDLAKRKLIPALYSLSEQDRLPKGFAVLGVGRTELSNESFRDRMIGSISQFASHQPVDSARLSRFIQRLNYIAIDTNNPEDFAQVKSRLEALDSEYDVGGNYIYYLSIAPSMYEIITENLAWQGLQVETGEASGWRRIIVEKPFGYDLTSARGLNQKLFSVFREDQIYRIDHYLGKETVQNILVFRFSNGIFEPLWNRNYISHIEITAAEEIGVEGRGGYYERAGAIRDMVQNHLLNILGIIAMEPPSSFQADAVRNELVKVFDALRPTPPDQVDRFVVRGQYTDAVIDGKKLAGYRDEEGIPPYSRTETYVGLKTFIDNWRWGGIPFFIRTGKRLSTRVTEVVVHFKPTPQLLFSDSSSGHPAPNQLILRIQPDEGILLMFGMKLPGAGFQVKNVNMDFHYSDLSTTHVPEAYERLLLDCMLGDATLYARRDAVEACWRFVDPILQNENNNLESQIFGYAAGSWGPQQSNSLFKGYSDGWRFPCKLLGETGTPCEL